MFNHINAISRLNKFFSKKRAQKKYFIIILYTYYYYSINTTLFTKSINPLNASPTKWSNTLKEFVGIVIMSDSFIMLALKRLTLYLSMS